MKFKIFVLLLALLLGTGSALATVVEELIPPGGVLESSEEMGSIALHKVRIPDTGEVLVIAENAGGQVLFVETKREAECAPDAPPVSRERAKELMRIAYPDCCVLFARDSELGKELGVAGENFCGTVILADDRIRSRSLETGEIFRDGKLTLDGALKVLKLLRPEAQFRALELDEEDGVWVYEGEALVNGEAYEFELDVSTGRLLEWERD